MSVIYSRTLRFGGFYLLFHRAPSWSFERSNFSLLLVLANCFSFITKLEKFFIFIEQNAGWSLWSVHTDLFTPPLQKGLNFCPSGCHAECISTVCSSKVYGYDKVTHCTNWSSKSRTGEKSECQRTTVTVDLLFFFLQAPPPVFLFFLEEVN